MKFPRLSVLALSATSVLAAPLEKKQQGVTDLDILQFALTVSIKDKANAFLGWWTLTEILFPVARAPGKRLL